jgi:hypothetical protein
MRYYEDVSITDDQGNTLFRYKRQLDYFYLPQGEGHVLTKVSEQIPREVEKKVVRNPYILTRMQWMHVRHMHEEGIKTPAQIAENLGVDRQQVNYAVLCDSYTKYSREVKAPFRNEAISTGAQPVDNV